MKSYDVTLKLYHESFKGYDLCDGERIVTVEASNPEVAKRKAMRLVKQTHGGWSEVVFVS